MVLRNARPLWNKKWTRRLKPAFLVFDVLRAVPVNSAAAISKLGMRIETPVLRFDVTSSTF
jgi:hypothetical protein